MLRMAASRWLRMSGRWMEAKLWSGLADGNRQRARRFLLSVASARKRARAAAAATEWMRKERCLRVAQVPPVPASKRSPSSSALSASPLWVVARGGGLGGGGPAGELGEACGVEGVTCGSGSEAVAG